MKNLYTFLIWSTALTVLNLHCNAQLIIEADAVVASSSDFVQANVLVDGNPSNYAYIDASVNILSTSSITVSFPTSGHAGDIISFDVQESGLLLNLLSLSTSLLNNVTIKVYDESNALVATGSGTSVLGLNLSLSGSNIYTIRYMTDATANYKIKKVTLELSNLLNVNTFKEFRIYNAKLQTPCPPVYADGIISFSNSGPLGPYVTNSGNAISASTTDFATMNAPILSNPILDLSFSTKGSAGEYVGVTINQSGAILSLSLLKSLILEAYSTAGVKVATSPSFALADLRLIDGTTDKYYLGFITPAGSYDISHLKLTFGGLNLLASLNVFNAMHFKLLPAPVSITSATNSFCAGSSISLTANAPGLTNIAWSNGATGSPITVSTAGTYSYTAKDASGCMSTSSTITVTALPIPTINITNGITANFCAGKNVVLSSTPSAGASVLWSNGATTNNITVNTAGNYTVTAKGANGCSSVAQQVVVSQLALPTLSITNGPIAGICTGKDVTLTSVPSAGSTVQWSNGVTNNSITVSLPGVYTATATDANLCASLPQTVTVSLLTLPTLTLTTGSTASFCTGKDVVLSSVPSAGATVAWNNGATTNNITVNVAGTYTVTATDANLCVSLPKTVTVTALPLPTLNITNGTTASFCTGKDLVLSSVPSAGATVAWNTGATTTDITVNAAGTYTVTATDANLCATLPKSITVTALPLPTLSVSNGTTAVFCAGKDVLLSSVPSVGATVLWNTGATTNDITVNTAGTYTVTATDVNLCASLPLSVTVSSLDLPILDLTTGLTASFCAGKDVVLSSLPSPGATVLWNNGATTNDITVNTAGTYTVTATDANLCASLPKSVVVTELAVPTLSLTNGTTASFCADKDILLSSVPSAGATVRWNNGATTNDITVNTAGTYTVTATNANLCASLPLSVTVLSLPVPTLTLTTSETTGFCTGKNVVLSSIPSAGSTVLWSNGSTTNDITVNTAGTYTVTATDANLCISLPKQIIVSEYALPTLSITNGTTASFCADKQILLSSVVSAGATVVWNNGETTTDITVNTAGTYTATATDINLCASLPQSVTVTALPVPTLTLITSGATGFCTGQDVVLSSLPSAGASVLWSNGASTNDITVNTAGIYTVTAMGANLCTSVPESIVVAEFALPTLSISNGTTAEFCENGDVELISIVSAGATVVWDNGATTNNITVSTAGTYTVTATDGNLCISLPQSVLVSSKPAPTVSIAASGATDICSNSTVMITATASAGSDLVWSTGETGNSITANAAGDYSVTATAVNGCSNTSAIIPVTIKLIPDVTSVATDITCNGNANGMISITPTSASASYQYVWDNGATTDKITQLGAGTYKIDITDNANTCGIHLEFEINEPAVLSLNGTTVNSTCADNDGQIKLNISGGIAPYSYLNRSMVLDPSNTQLYGFPADTHIVTIFDKNMCAVSESFIVLKADCDIALNIHNVVTPNNDGLNDVLVVDGIENFPNTSIQIFDKWGDVVFKNDDYENNWTGRNKNDSGPLPAGTYYYLLKLSTPEVPDGKSEYTGFVMIQ